MNRRNTMPDFSRGECAGRRPGFYRECLAAHRRAFSLGRLKQLPLSVS